MFLISSCSYFCSIHWSQVLSREWRCSWSSADRRCSNYIWVIDNCIVYLGATYIRGFTDAAMLLGICESWLLLQHLPGANGLTKAFLLFGQLDLLCKFHKAPVPHPIMHNFVTEMCTCVHKGPVTQGIGILAVGLNKLFNKQSSCVWF